MFSLFVFGELDFSWLSLSSLKAEMPLKTCHECAISVFAYWNVRAVSRVGTAEETITVE